MTDPATPDAQPPRSPEPTSPDAGSESVTAESAGAGTATGDTSVEAAVGAAAAGATGGPVADAVADAVAEPAAEPARRHRHPFYLRGRRPRLPRSRRGLFALLLVLTGIGGIAVFTGVSLIQWTETADFCGRCHTMSPELTAYEHGAHRDVACAECHVEPGIAGWVKAKLNGTRQLVDVVLGTFPEPIPPPDHADLPVPSDTCAKCHDVSRQALTALKTRTQFSEDEANTRQFVGLLVRPGGGDVFATSRSVHWHVLRTVTYWTSDPRSVTIDYVEAETEGGTIQAFISQDKVKDSSYVQPDVAAIKATETAKVMSCYDCHNRAGHAIPNPRTEVDYRMSIGQIDPKLPYIKREAMRMLWTDYPDVATADAAADNLTQFYKTNYPDVAASRGPQIESAIEQLKVLYRLTATPEMKVSAKTYPDHLGHSDFPGCFRCHDGGHYLIEGGIVTKKAIPSSCDTCHTFPQIGPAVASLPLGEPPSTHQDSLWVFNHNTAATSVDPGNQSCGECHARDYCVNCHSTGAVTVKHDAMATNHAQVIRDQGNTACAYCHQPPFCARCHTEPVLPVTTPFLQGVTIRPPTAAEGVSWPLAIPNPHTVTRS
ncbi:MAG TPA: NapC/NirT family cytochrome c [Candidatus Limnocylindrales bacterium]